MALNTDLPVAVPLAPLQTPARWIVRATWLLVAAFILTLFLAGLPSEFVLLNQLCPATSCLTSPSHQLTLAEAEALHTLGLSLSFYAGYAVVLDCIVAVVFGMIPVLLFWRCPDDRTALLTSFALLFGVGALTNAPQALAIMHPGWRFPVALATLFGDAGFILFLYLFPNGRWVPRWIWVIPMPWIIGDALDVFVPSFPLDESAWPEWLQFLIFFCLLASVIAAQIYRYQRVSTDAQRSQTKWVVVGIVIAFGTSIVVNALFAITIGLFATPATILIAIIGSAVVLLGLLAIPICLSVALARYQLYTSDRILQRTLVSGMLTAGIVGFYVLLVGVLSLLVQGSSNAVVVVLATGIVALIFHPLRVRLQLGVSRLFYGKRDEPYAVLADLNRRLEAALATEDVIPTIVASVAQALKLPYVALALKQDEEFVIAATLGTPVEQVERLPLLHQGAQIGELRLAPRSQGESFTPADRQLLADLAREAGIAVHTVRQALDLQQLNAALRSSRAQIVAAREEERRRLRRDLHDGLGSVLTSVTLKLGAARNLIACDAATAATLLDDTKAMTQAAIADIRHLVYDLRPPALDELGLVAALREHVGHIPMDGVQVMVDAPGHLPDLSAAVEVAAFRIALEGLANCIKHAHASRCVIRLNTTLDTFTLEIADDGVGFPPDYHPGVGLTAMRERAAELSGTFQAESSSVSGTRIFVTFPW